MVSKPQKRTISEINRKLAAGKAVVMTASEFCQAVRSGKKVAFEDVDIVTAATCGLMSGTYAVLSFKFSEPNRFVKASQLFFNGIEGYPGPCPNERIGIIDAIIHGTNHSRDDSRYGGGHLFRDIVAGKEIEVEVVTDEGETIRKAMTLDEMPHAVLHGSRHAFKNYVGFVNPHNTDVSTIFCSSPLPSNLGGVTAAGCGEINPVQKDPGLRTIGVGTRLLLNGGPGYVVGLGTRSSLERPCLSVTADMHTMNPNLMGGFQTSAGPEVIQTLAVPIPIIDETVLQTAKTLDEEIPLVITDVKGRAPLTETTYADMWVGTARKFIFDAKGCAACRENCEDCPPALLCPSGAFTDKKDKINGSVCYHCGICAVSCHGNCFVGELGNVVVDEKKVPFIQRLSDRVTATNAAAELKRNILKNKFQLSEPVEKIKRI
jgi:putative methanogenesis marker 16 metalloprotein